MSQAVHVGVFSGGRAGCREILSCFSRRPITEGVLGRAQQCCPLLAVTSNTVFFICGRNVLPGMFFVVGFSAALVISYCAPFGPAETESERFLLPSFEGFPYVVWHVVLAFLWCGSGALLLPSQTRYCLGLAIATSDLSSMHVVAH